LSQCFSKLDETHLRKQLQKHLGFREFCDILRWEKPQTLEDLTRAFRKIDINGDGYITHSELKRVLTKYGEKMSDDEVKLLIEEADVNHDGKLDYQEFCQMVMSTSKECQSNALKKLAVKDKDKSKPSKATSSTGAKGSPKKNKQKKQTSENRVDYGYLEQSDGDEPTSVPIKERKSSVPKISSNKASPVTSPQRKSSVSPSPIRSPAEKTNQTAERKFSLKTESPLSVVSERRPSLKTESPPAVTVEDFVVSEGSGVDEDDLIVVAPSGRGKLESKSETVLSAGGLSTDAVDKLKSKSTTLLKKIQKEPALDLSAPGSPSTSVSKGKKSKVKEPKNLKSWHKAHGKGCFYLHESKILSHCYRLDLPCASAAYITVNPPAAEVSGRSPVDVILLVVGKGSEDTGLTTQLIDFTDTQKSKKPSLRTDLRAETYDILSFTTGCRLKKRVTEPAEEKTLLDETGNFTLDTRHALDEIFKRVDLDGDGKLSRNEFNYFQVECNIFNLIIVYTCMHACLHCCVCIQL
jgi:Ca2+-binding EF-hand superfamily protein